MHTVSPGLGRRGPRRRPLCLGEGSSIQEEHGPADAVARCRPIPTEFISTAAADAAIDAAAAAL